MDLPRFQGEHKESLYWGTYRPHVCFGIRSRTPRSLIAGLMWIGLKDGRFFIRHVCQGSDELSRYGWTQHNVLRIDVQSEKSRWNDDLQKNAYLFFYLADEDGSAIGLSQDTFHIHGSSLLASGSRADNGHMQATAS
ncbi:hypothetical protein SLE2022_047800 [Rubroshorea leprosula]